MGIANDLLAIADRLAQPMAGEPQQASFRRAISTAYYALFHLLIQEAVQSWNGSSSARSGLERRFEHRTMKEVSNSIVRGKWRGWSTPSLAIPIDLEAVAAAFVELQEARLQADYDNTKTWSSADARVLVEDVHDAFANWTTVRAHPAAKEYLLSLLIGDKRE
ncbi:MAG: hypothetical protein ACLPWF_19810 [Bryobacteraceae bacterium]|jgi:hypothetical protein